MSRYTSPLRYPGGKQRLAPFIAAVLSANELTGGHYVEPYAGGAGAAVQLLIDGHVSHIHLNDLSRPVYAFWRSALTQTDAFCRLIAKASLTVDEWRRQKAILARPSSQGLLTLGFSFFYLNRCNRSGIPSGGVIGGLNQKGNWKMDARFARQELIRRVEIIAARRSQITFKNWDAERFVREYIPKLPKKTLVYCDPPYFAKAERLYLNTYEPEDHSRVAKTIQRSLKRPWIVSYDAEVEIMTSYAERRAFVYDLQYNACKVYRGNEVLFLSDDLALPDSAAIDHMGMRRKKAIRKRKPVAN